MKKFTLAVHSLGNIGTRVVEAALAAPDSQCLGVIRRAESLGTQSHALKQPGFGLETATMLRDALIPERPRDDSAL